MENKKQIKLYLGDNMENLKKLPDNSIDSVVTDAPYGLGKEQDMNIVLKDWIEKGYSEIKGKGFMGKEWDAYVPQPLFWKEAIRTLKPGGHVLCFFGSRTYDIGVMAMRLAGFEIRDTITWNFGSGFPKSLNIGKAFDKKVGNEREVVGDRPLFGNAIHEGGTRPDGKETLDITKGSSPYEGWGTALKPAAEYIVMARKPLSEKTIVDNVIKWGTGGINVDGCRIGFEMIKSNGYYNLDNDLNSLSRSGSTTKSKEEYNGNIKEGRFPANIIFDESAAEMLDEQSGISKSTKRITGQDYNKKSDNINIGGGNKNCEYVDKGGASRFFYVAKVGKKERNLGLDGFEDKETTGQLNLNKCIKCNNYYMAGDGRELCSCAEPEYNSSTIQKNNHPTLKPINLMTYLCRLITPPGGIVLDPFMGSGSTGISACLEGFRFVGMELQEDYFKIAEARINSYEEYRKLLK